MRISTRMALRQEGLHPQQTVHQVFSKQNIEYTFIIKIDFLVFQKQKHK